MQFGNSEERMVLGVLGRVQELKSGQEIVEGRVKSRQEDNRKGGKNTILREGWEGAR